MGNEASVSVSSLLPEGFDISFPDLIPGSFVEDVDGEIVPDIPPVPPRKNPELADAQLTSIPPFHELHHAYRLEIEKQAQSQSMEGPALCRETQGTNIPGSQKLEDSAKPLVDFGFGELGEDSVKPLVDFGFEEPLGSNPHQDLLALCDVQPTTTINLLNFGDFSQSEPADDPQPDLIS
eukprot:CAMPEP_0177631620 /NCGR_PEP_ID=MMETSP0447-20121125/1847_1 /TAXON_ID=0 /ORGANISM="Stygamoeba regulata, Strain BSH-02190019" /LENGTH=178 /DNA_ID=CAMNT_0019133117 /DNA_START=38 /DNA_END=574 /DNA_ORIENTATION=-